MNITLHLPHGIICQGWYQLPGPARTELKSGGLYHSQEKELFYPALYTFPQEFDLRELKEEFLLSSFKDWTEFLTNYFSLELEHRLSKLVKELRQL